MTHAPAQVTQLLREWAKGNQDALHELMPAVYAELRRMAKWYMSHQNPGHTLQPTALIHEAYLRMAGETEKDWQNRAHFFAVAATAMRHVLVDRARAHQSAKLGGRQQPVSFNEPLAISTERYAELIALDDALRELESLHSRQARVIELRFFAGLSVDETAEILGISPETVMRDWRAAKAWLHRELQRGKRSKPDDA